MEETRKGSGVNLLDQEPHETALADLPEEHRDRLRDLRYAGPNRRDPELRDTHGISEK